MTPIEHLTVSQLLEALASKTPAPGGGAVAAAVGALAGALGEMVIAYSVGKASLEAHRAELDGASTRLREARERLLALAREDAEAFARLSELRRLPPGDEGRVSEEPAAKRRVLDAPRATLEASIDLLVLLETLTPITNRWLHSDLAIAAVLAEATARAAAWNVRVNLSLLDDPGAREALERERERMTDDAAERAHRVEAGCRGEAS
ncbi:MAG: cyclodeaminase/cyclohydrolase family protein [Phycisphaerales bacterium JB059]